MDEGDLNEEGALEQRMSNYGVPGAPTWPIPPTDTRQIETPPVGLRWSALAERFRIDERVLRHGGTIVAAGEYFPEAGFAVDPGALRARAVDVGDQALGAVYFVGKLMANEFRIRLPVERPSEAAGTALVGSAAGPVTGLFVDEDRASAAKREILQGSLGSGVSMQRGPLGVELRVSNPELAGRVATVIASEGGAVISIGGVPAVAARTAAASGPDGQRQDVPRGGTGATSDSTG